jgi:hypothetical protein
MSRNFYNRPHKALRAMMADTLVAVGRMDPRDECEVRDTIARLEDLLVACEKHVKHENEFVHRAIEAKRPGASCALAEEHVGHLRAIEDLRAAATARAPDLQRRLAVFVAENLEHMEHEESAGNALLAELFTDAEIEAIEGRLVAAIPPGDFMQFLRWMLPALHHGERVELLQGMRHAPGPVRHAVMGVAQTHLRAPDFARLEAALAQREPATLAS